MRSEMGEHDLAFGDLLAALTDSDVVIELVASGGSTSNVGTQLLQDAVEASYRALSGPIEVKLETVAKLDEITRRSHSLWLRAVTKGASTTEDHASLLKFLARGMLAMIAWMDGSSTHKLSDLQQAIRVLAWGTSITTSAHPVLPSSADLVSAVTAWQRAKSAMGAGASVRINTNNGSADIDLSRQLREPRSLLQSRRLVNHSADMIFVVEMPDYQSTGEWTLKHGDTRTTVGCEPGTLLDRFYRRELDIRPGDALRCRVDVETSYGPDHEVLCERYQIVEVIEVLTVSRATVEREPLVRNEFEPHEGPAELEPTS